MDQDINNLLARIEFDIEYAKKIASGIARGTGGREIALMITKLQEAGMWLAEGQRLIGLEGGQCEDTSLEGWQIMTPQDLVKVTGEHLLFLIERS